MIAHFSLLVTLVLLVEEIPMPVASAKRGRGRPPVYQDRLFLQDLVSLASHLGTASGGDALNASGPNRLFGSLFGASAPTLATQWTGGCHRFHAAAGVSGTRLAQKCRGALGH